MKRKSSCKSNPLNDLASIALSTSLSNHLTDLNNNNSNNNNNTIGDNLSNGLDSNGTLSTGSFVKSASITCSSSSNVSFNSSSHKAPLREICLSIPLAKPNLNELKPQLSIDTKMKTKSLIERSYIEKDFFLFYL